MGLPQAPFVSFSFVSEAAAATPTSAPVPAHLSGGTNPRWRRRNPRGPAGGVRCTASLPLPSAARMRPVQTLRVEVMAMDRAFGHT